MSVLLPQVGNEMEYCVRSLFYDSLARQEWVLKQLFLPFTWRFYCACVTAS